MFSRSVSMKLLQGAPSGTEPFAHRPYASILAYSNGLVQRQYACRNSGIYRIVADYCRCTRKRRGRPDSIQPRYRRLVPMRAAQNRRSTTSASMPRHLRLDRAVGIARRPCVERARFEHRKDGLTKCARAGCMAIGGARNGICLGEASTAPATAAAEEWQFGPRAFRHRSDLGHASANAPWRFVCFGKRWGHGGAGRYSGDDGSAAKRPCATLAFLSRVRRTKNIRCARGLRSGAGFGKLRREWGVLGRPRGAGIPTPHGSEPGAVGSISQRLIGRALLAR